MNRTDGPVIIAHRGLNRIAPENTLSAFRAASLAGVQWIETDTDLISDGTPIIMHDSRTDRTTDRSGSIYELTCSELAHLDAGSWFSSDFSRERVPTLRQLVGFLNEHRMNANIELKANAQGGSRSLELVAAVIDELARLDDGIEVIISSFSELLLSEFHRREQRYPLGLLTGPRGLGRDWRSVVELCGVSFIHPEAHCLTAEWVQELAEFGLGVNAWTVNSAHEANKLMNWGCTGIITDVADQLNDHRLAQRASAATRERFRTAIRAHPCR